MSRDNFGPNVAQIAGAALLISYTITVAVSVAAGSDAITSAVPSLRGAVVPMSVAFVVLIAYGNLRGLREAGRFFAIPTYFFIANMAVLIAAGLIQAALGDLGHVPTASGQIPLGKEGQRPAARGVAVLRGPGVRQWRIGHDGYRGDLQRRQRVPPTPGR